MLFDQISFEYNLVLRNNRNCDFYYAVMYMNDVKEFEVCQFKEEMYFSNSVTSLVYSEDIKKKISSRGNLESLMFLKSI